MSFRLKRGAVLALLAVFAVWPLAHRYLVERSGMSPWRLFGWAMYCVPAYRPDVKFFAVRGGERVWLKLPRTPANERALASYLERRGQLGALLPPGELAPLAFAADPEVRELVIIVSRTVFDLETARGRTEGYWEYAFTRAPPP